ncbi:hypothetical protein L5515_017075 [Caenorhabditis briggsae]|uniref:SCP domain-containing protein n=1 Tax=Caenorhabditis briggsae TaxID=6238 RepID=A0AAE9F7M5_CAEBR|nr:hypothetical protein L5515_017075 [Caenorhabditis briggsae]
MTSSSTNAFTAVVTKNFNTRNALCLLITIMNGILFVATTFIIFNYVQSTNIEGSGSDDLIEQNVWNDVDDKVVEALGGLDEELLTEHVCNESTITQLQQEIILTTHNELRRSLAYGKQRNKRGLMNSARNMYKLDWDCELAALAANWSASCPQHFMPQSVLGSNAQLFKRFYYYFDGHDSTVHMRNAMKYWWQQGEERGNEDQKNRFFARRNYFGWANMAKGKTYRVGCSYIMCPDTESALFTCLYNEKAQCEKEMIYENGKPCCEDKDCFTYPGSKCLVPEGLCQAPQMTKDSGDSMQCNNPQVSDVTRNFTLEQHNFYRSRLAKGFEWNGETNSSQPKASQMIKMEYDCMLERFAQNWANKCVFAHSSHYERPNQGQNLYMSSFVNPDPRSLIHTAVEKWWQELEEFGTPIDNVLTPELWDLKGKAIGHYTQMAWDRTYRLGCGIANCPKMSYVVCHYGPAGNRKNNKIYEIGDPCEIDDDCPIGTDCEKTTSLCVISKEWKK